MDSNDVDARSQAKPRATDEPGEGGEPRPNDGFEPPERFDVAIGRIASSPYPRASIGLAGAGALFGAVGVVLPAIREFLFVLAATALFGAVLASVVANDRFVPAPVAERVYATGAANQTALVEQLGLDIPRRYLPVGDATVARLYVSQERTAPETEAPAALGSVDAGALFLEPTGEALFREFEASLSTPLRHEPGPLAEQLVAGLVDGIELVQRGTVERTAADRATIAVEGSAYGAVDRFDHPVASFLAVGFVAGLDRPVRVEVEPGSERRFWFVTCRWDPEAPAE